MFKLALILAFLYQSSDFVRDSLKRELKNSQEPASKANLYYLLGDSYYVSDPDLAISYSDSSLYFSDIANLSKMRGNALNIKSVSYIIKSDFENALKFNLESLKAREALQDTVGLIESYINLGNILYRKGENNEAAERYKKALVYALMADNKKGQSLIYNNLGSFFRDKWKAEKEQVDLDSAMYYLTKSLEMKNALKDFRGSISTLLNLSELAQAQKNSELAESYLNKALELSEGLQNPEILTSLYGQLVDFNLEFGSKSNAIQYSLKAVNLAENLNSNFLLSTSAEYAIKSHEAIGDYRAALEFSKIKMKADRILNDESKQKIEKDLLVQYETEKKDIENQKLLEEQRFLDLSLRRRNELLLGAGIILLGLIGLGFYQRESNKQLTLTKESLSEILKQLTAKNDEIHRKSILLSQANKELEASNAIRERLLSVVSHDVKAPLNSLQVILEYWDQKIFSQEDVASIIPQIALQTRTVQSLLNNLLEWAQTQMQYSNLQFLEVNLYELVENAILFASPSAAGKKLKVQNLIPNDIFITTDKDRLNFIIRNLISNAMKFTKPDGSVEISYDTIGNGRIHVKDTGIGLSKSKIQELFFNSMGPSKGTEGEKGSGVGLLLCREFAESLGASLSVASEENIGSTFTINLGKVSEVKLGTVDY